MITGFMGISYSTDEIKNGRFVDKTLESDFMQARFNILRSPERHQMNESAWRSCNEEARREFLKMMEDAEERNKIKFDDDEDEDVRDASSPFTYDGSGDVPKDIQTVIITNDVDEIPDEAFKDCTALKSIVFNDNLKKIGKNAFENCPELVNVRLNGITYIGDEAFQNCTGLLSIELGSSLQHIGMGAFRNCSKLGAVTVPPNLTFMGDFAFANCAELKNVNVMDGVVEVSAYAFQNCPKLEQVLLPMSVEKVANTSFENCPNVEVYVPTMNLQEAEEILDTKMVAKAEDDECMFKCKAGYIVRLYKDLY